MVHHAKAGTYLRAEDRGRKATRQSERSELPSPAFPLARGGVSNPYLLAPFCQHAKEGTMKIGPIKNKKQYKLAQENRKGFRTALAQLEKSSPPGDIDPILWQAQGDSYRSIIADFDEAIGEWERRP
jgi:hypothetical protein